MSRTSRPRLLVALSALLAVVVALTSACGPEPKKAGGGAGKSGSASGTAAVHVKNFSFNPQNLTVTKGTKVTWTFEDSTNHNVLASDKSFKSKDLKNGATYSFTFNTPGKYAYICGIHQYMTGSVTVK